MVAMVGQTHPGNRDHNEDCVVADAALGFAMVADGMGGYACGEVASAMVRDVLLAALQNNEGLAEAIGRAHNQIKDAAAADDSQRGMGSTVVAVKLRDYAYEIAWVGDSRAYLWDGELKQITRDHSYVESLLSNGLISEAEALKHPNRNLITQAVGSVGNEGLDIGLVQGRLGAGQCLLLCSDGLVDELSDLEIARLLNAEADPAVCVEQLISAACAAGGRDNISVALVCAPPQLDGSAVEPDPIRVTALDGRSQRVDRPVSATSSPLQRGSEEEPQWQRFLAYWPVLAGCLLLLLALLLYRN